MDNKEMTFNVKGRKKKEWELSDTELVGLLEGNYGKITDEEREALIKTLIMRYRDREVPREGEDNDNLFARQFSRYVNGMARNYQKTASIMAKDHRYLQNEMFKLFTAYVRELAVAHGKKFYDPRNEYACEASAKIVKALGESGYVNLME